MIMELNMSENEIAPGKTFIKRHLTKLEMETKAWNTSMTTEHRAIAGARNLTHSFIFKFFSKYKLLWIIRKSLRMGDGTHV